MSSESASVRPEIAAFQDLAQLVRHLEDELASFRRRALTAEARLKEIESVTGSDPSELAALKRENAELTARLDAASTRTRALLDRVHFVRQQATRGEK
jgi:predicted  nucleic acid-binding Zn-ribbon protein